MINEIIDLINNGLDGLHPEAIVLGIVQRVYRIDSSDVVQFMPGIVKPDGEAIYAGIDDVKSMMIYHKPSSANLSFGGTRTGYGDGRSIEDSFAFSLVAVWDTRKIPLQSVDMLLLLRSRMPQEIKGVPQIKQVQIIPSFALLNTKQVFEGEYTVDKDYLLPIYMNLIQLNYTIQIKYDQQCIDECINCSK